MLEKLKEALKKEEIVYGTEKTLKNLKKGETKVVFLSSNTPEEIRDEVKHYADLSGAEVVELDLPDNEIGLLTKRRHSVSVLSY